MGKLCRDPAGPGGAVSEDFQVRGGLQAGALVAGYRIESRIGSGGMAVVFRARDERLGRSIALKVMAPEWTGDEEYRRRFVAVRSGTPRPMVSYIINVRGWLARISAATLIV